MQTISAAAQLPCATAKGFLSSLRAQLSDEFAKHVSVGKSTCTRPNVGRIGFAACTSPRIFGTDWR
jgi:hypothetical protein